MKIFLSYASAHRTAADDLCCRLQAAGHEVFFDREDLPPGKSYDDRIRAAIEGSDLFVFLISPESVAEGHYTRTELKIASRKWPTPGWHVLPVMLVETPLANVPAYLRSLTILRAEGNLAAEVVIEVEDRAPSTRSDVRQAHALIGTQTGLIDATQHEHYHPVHIRFARGPDGHYAVEIPESPLGAIASTPCTLDASELDRSLWSEAKPMRGAMRRSTVGLNAQNLLPTAQQVREVGGVLHAALFNSSIATLLQVNMRTVDPQKGTGLRYVIDTTNTPELARLPWEFLYDSTQDDFLFANPLLTIVRWLEVDAPLPTLRIAPPLRVLIAVASPMDRPELGIGAELAQLDAALAELTADGLVETVRLDHSSLESLDDALLRTRPHVLHFIGHGDFAGDDGVLLLETQGATHRADPITGRQLAVLLRNHLASLRLVFLNSCMGAVGSIHDPFGGIAQRLVARGVPAAIAMQFPVSDKAAVTTAKRFYTYLAAGRPVDAALSSARAFLFARNFAVEWGAPVLYMRAPDGRLFDIERAITRDVAVEKARSNDPNDTTQARQAEPTNPRRSVLTIVIGATAALLLVILGGIFLTDEFATERGELTSPLPSDSLDVSPPPPAPAPPAPDPTEWMLHNAEQALEIGDIDAARHWVEQLQSMESPSPALESRIDVLDRALGILLTEELYPAAASAAGAAGESMTYIVQSGDTLWRIAERLTGHGADWPRLLERHNQLAAIGVAEHIGDPHQLRPGLRFAVPLDPQGNGAVVQYHVTRGDTLWRIAERFYDDPHQWVHIQRANMQQIQDPNLIFPGQVLQLSPLQ